VSELEFILLLIPLIEKIQNNELSDKIMMNVHPQRWFDYGYHWKGPSETLLRRMPSACFTG
jgi:hypothetical protein